MVPNNLLEISKPPNRRAERLFESSLAAMSTSLRRLRDFYGLGHSYNDLSNLLIGFHEHVSACHLPERKDLGDDRLK
jgi:hypothetical protein